MRGRIEECWLLALRVDPAKVALLLPHPLELVRFGGFAFFNVVISRLSRMRPAPLPAWMGMGYWHAAYRLYARYQDQEGLYFLRSDADSPLMVSAGNLLTDFRFHLSRVERDANLFVSDGVGTRLKIQLTEDEPKLSEGSPFRSLYQASEFLKYKPAALAVHNGNVDVLRITRDESKWKACLRNFKLHELTLLEEYEPVPEILYEMEPIDYQWNRARRLPK